MLSENKIFRIGIDKISLYNFSIETEKRFKKLTDYKENSLKEKTIITDELFSIVNSYTVYQGEKEVEESFFNRITFNPNKILTGDNICNSTTLDLKEAIEKLTLMLKEKEIYIDFSDSRIADIEINLNVPIDFNEYSEVFMLFFKQINFSKAISAITDSERVKNFKIDESFFTRINKSVTFKVYSKDREKNLNASISRLEYFFETSSYKYISEKFGKDNSLATLLKNNDLIELIFRERLKKDFIKKAFNYIENRIKPVLEKEYLAFKKANILARSTGRKEERNIYRYLEEFWIFDYSFLIDIIGKYDSKHKGRETKKILEKYIQHNNLKKLNYLLELIFPH